LKTLSQCSNANNSLKAVGFDIGSRLLKIVVLTYHQGKYKVLLRKTLNSIKFYQKLSLLKNKNSIKKILTDLVSSFTNRDISTDFLISATGYGKYNLSNLIPHTVPELLAHKKGIELFIPFKNFLFIDIGGQDTKIVKVQNREIVDFILNDRCAASSGKFLENMANALKVKLNKFLKIHCTPAKINTTCAIFAETELLSRLINGEDLNSLIAGVNFSVANRLIYDIKKLLTSETEVMIFTGGVAIKNSGIHKYLKAEFNIPVIISKFPKYTGAIGAAAYALEKELQ